MSSTEPIDPLTGLPVPFVRMLAARVDPFNDAAPRDSLTEPLDEFFRALMRVQSFRDCHGKPPKHFGT
jgi:hypothetical protein